MAKFSASNDISSEELADEESGQSKRNLRRRFCSVLNCVSTLTRDLIIGPNTGITDCLNAFFDDCELKGDNKYYCCHCKRWFSLTHTQIHTCTHTRIKIHTQFSEQ